MSRLAIVLLAFASFASPAFAHKASDAYLTIERNAQSLHGQWDIALRDLDNALGLDANGDGDITWGEVRQRQGDIAAYALPRLQVSSGGERCALTAGSQLVDTHTDGTYAVLMLTGDVSARRADARDRLSVVRRDRSAAPRVCSTSSRTARAAASCSVRIRRIGSSAVARAVR